MSQDLLAALCLVLIIEGLLPFAAPRQWRDAARMASEAHDRTVRMLGAGAIIVGAIALHLVRG